MHPLVVKLLEQKFDEQRSIEWFKLRNNLLTASDLAAALRMNFFKTPEMLMVEKCGYKKKDNGNENTQRGIRLEPIVRDKYDAATNSKTHEFGLLVHPVHSWLGGSPDGVTEDGILVEIKCPKKISPKIPDYYYPQVQLLMEIMELEECDFVQYREDTDEMKIIRVPRSRAWFAEKLPIMKAFWDTVLYKRIHGLCEIVTESLPELSQDEHQVPQSQAERVSYDASHTCQVIF
jgi:putative phage-type endonuclease